MRRRACRRAMASAWPESEWHALEAARALDQFIERARATSLHHFAQRLNARMTCHAIERALRVAWRDYVAEVAGWGPADWRPAVMWTAHLPMLPAIDAILRGERPDWVLRDPDFAVLADEDMRQHRARQISALATAAGVRRRRLDRSTLDRALADALAARRNRTGAQSPCRNDSDACRAPRPRRPAGNQRALSP